MLLIRGTFTAVEQEIHLSDCPNFPSHLCHWLGFLERTELEVPAGCAASRVTESRLDAWVGEQRQRGNRSATIHGRLRGLYGALRVLEPNASIGFILRPGGISLNRAMPPTPRSFTTRDSLELLDLALDLFREGLAGLGYANGHAAVRDAALLGLLATRAPRIASIAKMKIGQHLRATPGGYTVAFDADALKAGTTLEYPVHEKLVPVFAHYLHVSRLKLGGGGDTDALWRGTKSKSLSERSLTKIVLRRTATWFACAHGPHWFRKCLRTTAARRGPDFAYDAAATMGHSAKTSIDHYADATSLYAMRRHSDRVTRLRRETRALAASRFGWQAQQ